MQESWMPMGSNSSSRRTCLYYPNEITLLRLHALIRQVRPPAAPERVVVTAARAAERVRSVRHSRELMFLDQAGGERPYR